MGGLHLKGFLQSLCSAIDCLAGCCIGVLGLDKDLRKADMLGVTKYLTPIVAQTSHVLNPYAIQVLDVESKAGPNGWLKYLVDFRNMLMHRGRRLIIAQLTPRPTALIHPDSGLPIVETDTQHFMTRAPNCSEAEMWSARIVTPLEEDADSTVDGLLHSVAIFLEETSKVLCDSWLARKSGKLSVQSPTNQWKPTKPDSNTDFQGYNPGSAKMEMSTMVGNPNMIARMKAALVDGDRILFWDPNTPIPKP